MSTFAVTVEQLTIFPHPNADALELAQVGLYRSIVRKGQFSTGDLALFIPEQALLPDSLVEELGLTGKLAGKAKNRVKAVRLRGELSQGLVALPNALVGIDYETSFSYGEDFSEFLGITKWVPEVPIHMSGQAFGTSEMLSWVDIENIKRYPDIFTLGESVTATEKVHGSCTLFTRSLLTGENFVSSKGLGSKNLALVETEENLYWRAVRAYRLESLADTIGETINASRVTTGKDIELFVTHVGIFGEVYGQGVQDLAYGENASNAAPGYAVFDIRVNYNNGQDAWLSQDEVRRFTFHLDIPMVPELYSGPYDPEVIASLAEGKETISGHEMNIREGVVVRPAVERRSDILGGRAIGKWVGEAYLTRKNATEFE